MENDTLNIAYVYDYVKEYQYQSQPYNRSLLPRHDDFAGLFVRAATISCCDPLNPTITSSIPIARTRIPTGFTIYVQ